MSTTLIAALAGAIVGFAGSGALQRARFRREDVREIDHRIGIALALHADLLDAYGRLELGLDTGHLPGHARFPLSTWQSGVAASLLAALDYESLKVLSSAFGDLAFLDQSLAAYPEPTMELDEAGDLMRPTIETFQNKVGNAASVLNRVEEHLTATQAELLQPWRHRWARLRARFRGPS